MKLSSQTITVLIISTVTALIAGLFLLFFKSYLIEIPGLIILIPVAMGTRGAIYGSLGAKLSSALHMGLINSFSLQNKFLREKMAKAFKINIFASFFLSIAIYGLTFANGIEVNPFFLISTSFLTGIISGGIILFTTYLVALGSYYRGWDPDNVTIPIISSFGDLITIPILLILSVFLIKAPYLVLIIISAVAIAMSLHFLKYILGATLAIIIIAIFFDVIAGFLLDEYLEILLTVPGILIIIPVFLSQGGSIIGIFSSRLVTRLHLGLSTKIRNTFRDGINVLFLGIIIFSLIVLLAYFAGIFLNIPVSIEMLFKLSLIGGTSLLFVSLFLAYSISIIAFKYKTDPDNVTIPIMNSVIDFLGVLFLIIVVNLL